METEIIILTILRLSIPLLIFKWPIIGIFISMYLDMQDWNYFTIRTDGDMRFYQIWDKLLDTYYLSIAFIISLRWKEKIARKISKILFTYRAIGVFIFTTLYYSRELLLFFPNLFENFFIFYMIFIRLTNNARLFINKKAIAIVLLSIIIPKLIAEYYLHVLGSPQVLDFLGRNPLSPLFSASPEGVVLFILYFGPTLAVLSGMIIFTRKKIKIDKASEKN